MRLALYQPDIAQNVGTIMRLGACLDVPVDVIEPCGFPFGDASMRRASLDYAPLASLVRHESWSAFRAKLGRSRLILMTTKGETDYTGFAFADDDTILMGRESEGVPDDVAAAAHARLRIPMKPGLRSLNVAVAAAMVLGEALRQTSSFPRVESR